MDQENPEKALVLGRPVPREKDDLVLSWLSDRLDGLSWPAIAKKHRVKSYQTIQKAVAPVLEELEKLPRY